MKTRVCLACGEPKPVAEFVQHDKRRPKPYVRSICHACHLLRQKESRRPRAKSLVPRVKMAPHFETVGPEDIWPKGRLFFRAEYEAGITEGVWPVGMRVKNEKGVLYEVALSLKRIGKRRVAN